jgi:gliding motility-associated-like protein
MPIYDVENNENGFIIELVRPTTSISHLALYWDDSNIPGFYFPPSGGCDGTKGCHKFDNFFGDERTINTWWYSTSEIVDSLEFFKPSVSLDQVNIENQSCAYKNDGSIEIIGSGGEPPFLYSISSNNFQNDNFFENLTAGEYTVVIKDKNNCTQLKDVSVELNTLIEASFETKTIGPYNTIRFEFTGEGVSNYRWDFGDGEVSNLQNPDHVFNYDTTYFVKLISESGAPDFCVDSTSSYLHIYAPLQLFAPTAFSPNGDNLNDGFQLIGSGFQFYEIYIFSRNGQQLFYTNNIDDSWDGTWNSELCEEGAYAFIATVKGKSGRTLQKKGTVILLR